MKFSFAAAAESFFKRMGYDEGRLLVDSVVALSSADLGQEVTPADDGSAQYYWVGRHHSYHNVPRRRLYMSTLEDDPLLYPVSSMDVTRCTKPDRVNPDEAWIINMSCGDASNVRALPGIWVGETMSDMRLQASRVMTSLATGPLDCKTYRGKAASGRRYGS